MADVLKFLLSNILKSAKKVGGSLIGPTKPLLTPSRRRAVSVVLQTSQPWIQNSMTQVYWMHLLSSYCPLCLTLNLVHAIVWCTEHKVERNLIEGFSYKSKLRTSSKEIVINSLILNLYLQLKTERQEDAEFHISPNGETDPLSFKTYIVYNS